MASDGIFIVEAGQPFDVNGQLKQRVLAMFVFEITSVDLSTTRIKPSPSKDPGGNWLIPISAQILLPTSAPDVLTALDDGTASYQMISFEWDSPIVIANHQAEMTALWQTIHGSGQHEAATNQFSDAGTWYPVIPT